MKKMFIAHDPWDNIVQFQKVWYPRNQLVEIFQITVVPKKIKKLGALPDQIFRFRIKRAG